MKIIVIIFTFLLLSGCVSTKYVLPDNKKKVNIEFVSEFKTHLKDSAQILAFSDAESCSNHENGVYIGLMCEKRPGYACEGFNVIKSIEANKPITLKVEYKFGDALSWEIGSCSLQMTFTPDENTKYRALYNVDYKVCSVALKKLDANKVWINDATVKYDKNLCTWK